MTNEITTMGSVVKKDGEIYMKIPESFSSYFETDDYVEMVIRPYKRICDMSKEEIIKAFFSQ